jgi:adenylate kinase
MIVFMGVAGAGKSVQGKLLAQDLGYQWISTGEYLRANINPQRRDEMMKGKLLADEEIIEIVEKLFADSQDQTIVDGFPRTMKQAEWLIGQHERNKVHISCIINLEASKNVILERLLSRGRPDDVQEVIEKRFDEYQEVTLPILGWFKEQGIQVLDINGERSIEDIHAEIMQKLRG